VYKEFDDDLALKCFFMVAFSQLLFPNTTSYIRVAEVTWTDDVPHIRNLNWYKAMVDNLR
jgi:hypothetical protein